jgi:hypothetical protein
MFLFYVNNRARDVCMKQKKNYSFFSFFFFTYQIYTHKYIYIYINKRQRLWNICFYLKTKHVLSCSRMSSTSGQQVRPVIECFCQILSLHGFSSITPEIFRLAKFNRNEAVSLKTFVFNKINPLFRQFHYGV